MFNRVTFEAWTTLFPIISFVLTFSVFVAIVVSAFRMSNRHRDTMAQLPLEDSAVSGEERKQEPPFQN